jgi:type I restriction enzyme S subunit
MMLPNGWKKVKLGDLVSVTSGRNKVRNDMGKYPVYGSTGIIGLCDDFQYSGDSILIARVGANAGFIHRANGQYDVSDNTLVVECGKEYDFAFAYQQLRGINLNQYVFGSGQPLITGGLLKEIELSLPPLEEQKKIVATLSVWDSAIEKMEKLIEAKENAKQFFFYKLVTENSCLWEIKKLSDFLTPGNKTPVLNTSLYRKMIVKLHKKGLEFNTQTREMADTRPFYIRNEGELIIGKQNYFNGSIAIVDKEHDQCICSNAIMSFSIKDIHPLYLYEYISDEEYLKKHSMLANGTGQKELSEKDFLNFEIRVPKRKQQDEIACVLNNSSLEIFLLHAQLENYKKQKQGLMQKLLTAQWRVK